MGLEVGRGSVGGPCELGSAVLQGADPCEYKVFFLSWPPSHPGEGRE